MHTYLLHKRIILQYIIVNINVIKESFLNTNELGSSKNDNKINMINVKYHFEQ